MQLSEKLIALRKEKGLSQLALSEKLNVSRQAISRWETGAAYPSTDNLALLAELYEVPVGYLLGKEGEKSAETVRQSDEVSAPSIMPNEANTAINTDVEKTKKLRKRRVSVKWIVVLLCVIILLAFTIVSIINYYNPKPIPMDDIQPEEVDPVVDTFKVNW